MAIPTLPRALAGIDASADSPWATARATGQAVVCAGLDGLPADLRAIAEREGLGGYWIQPVMVPPEPVLITLWMQAGGYPPAVHSQGMELAHSIVDVIMRWRDQQRRIDHAAFHDELTGLPNRKAFFQALESAPPGAVLYCDLDDFKPVNDAHGHAAGDAVLREIASRLRDAVRNDDLVARIGGDEFAVLCPGSTVADTTVLVERITTAVAVPIRVGDADVEVGISIGVAHTTTSLDEASLAAADRALYEMKAKRKSGGIRG
jgi:diguanylate cyclase (GGDEF)-like protein